jgi:hypothetical protein
MFCALAWFPHSPELTTLEFCLWCCVKDEVFSRRVNMLHELKARITATVTNHTEDYRWDIFTAADGTHCKVFCLLTACLLYNLCGGEKKNC